MKRTGSIGSAVPPALTTMCQPARSAGPARARARGAQGRIGLADGRAAGPPRPRHRRARRSRQAVPRPPRRMPGGRPRARRRVAERPQPLDVRDGGGMLVHLAVHRRRDDDRRAGGEAGRGHDVVGEPVRHRRQPARRGRRDEDGIGRVRGDDVADAPVGQELERVEHDRPARERLERERADELRRGAAHQDLDVGARGAQAAHEVGGLVGGDRAGDAEQDEAAFERPSRSDRPRLAADVRAITLTTGRPRLAASRGAPRGGRGRAAGAPGRARRRRRQARARRLAPGRRAQAPRRGRR